MTDLLNNLIWDFDYPKITKDPVTDWKKCLEDYYKYNKKEDEEVKLYSLVIDKEQGKALAYLAGFAKEDIDAYVTDTRKLVVTAKESSDPNLEIYLPTNFLKVKSATMENGLLTIYFDLKKKEEKISIK